MDLYREGFLNKAGKGVIQTRLHSWRPRYFVLDGPSLKYYKSKEIKAENMLGCIHLAEVESVGLMKNEKKCFQVTTKPPKPRTYLMSGRSEDEVMGWVRVIEMGKARQTKKSEDQNSRNTLTQSMYDVTTPPSQDLMGPPKPKRTMERPEKPSVPSAYFLLGPPSSPSNPTSCSPSTQPGISTAANNKKSTHGEYEFLKKVPKSQKSVEGDDDDHDPTYERVVAKGSDSPTKENPLNDKQNVENGLYDTVDVVPKNNDVSSAVSAPALPTRDPSISLDDTDDTGGSTNAEAVSGQVPFGIYDEIVIPSKDKPPEPSTKTGNEAEKAKPVYAKPMKKKSSKRRIPGMIDIGEVSNEIEEETAGGKETLEKGMTTPAGKHFAVEELREILDKYDSERNDNGESEMKLADFEVNEGESAFHALKRFLEQY